MQKFEENLKKVLTRYLYCDIIIEVGIGQIQKGDYMAKVVDIEKLKPLLKNVLTEENEAEFIESIMKITEDYDDEAVNARIEEASKSAREEASKEYATKLHDMFFGGAKEEDNKKVIEDDSNVDDMDKPVVEDIFEEVN